MQGISIATTGTEELAELFELAPVSLWLEDYSALREQFQRWRNEGVTDLRAFLLESPDRVSRCSSLIRVLAVNRRTLDLFEAESFDDLGLSDEMLRAVKGMGFKKPTPIQATSRSGTIVKEVRITTKWFTSRRRL